ncbi:hypothetical protein B0H14DRAFT_3514466 [Mycena olivaceomarginata]|nr:hypothetical protein B0H14DRAFT_3514466 [Mycena olivaceomarginata]
MSIQAHEKRFSFTQYTSAGIFRFVENGFRSDEDVYAGGISADEQAARVEARKARWELIVASMDIMLGSNTRTCWRNAQEYADAHPRPHNAHDNEVEKDGVEEDGDAGNVSLAL